MDRGLPPAATWTRDRGRARAASAGKRTRCGFGARIVLGVAGVWLSAFPAAAQPPSQAAPASVSQPPSQALPASASQWGEVPGTGSAVIKALRAPLAGAPPSPLAAASAGQAAPQQPAPILPPAGSPPLLRSIRLEFPTQGNVSVIEPQTYLFYIQTRPSRPSDGVWVPYDDAAEKSVLEDFKRLWATNFLDNLWIEVRDVPYDNGVMGKEVRFNMEERQRVKIVDYVGSKKIEQSKIEEKLREENVSIRLDSFIDPALIRRVEGIVRGMFSEKGYEFARVTHTITEVAGGPKLVNLTFNLDEGPRVKVKKIDFIGNKAISDGKLESQMKSNKSEWMWSWVTGRGTYQAAKFEEDADLIVEHYRNEGYVMARVGQPELRYVNDSTDRRTRYVELRVPVTEGERYRVGDLHLRRQHGHQERRPAGRLPGQAGHLLQREEDTEVARQGARSLRLARVLRVHGLSRHQAARGAV